MSLKNRRERLSRKIEEKKSDGNSVKHPSILKMAKNLAKSAKEAVKYALEEGDIKVEEEEFLDRLETCVECELFDPSEIRCSHESCGCYLKVKANLASATCPLYMWKGDIQKSSMYQ